jgi:DNA-binding CsgD family transcriptional regulator
MSDNLTYEELELKIKGREKHIVKLTKEIAQMLNLSHRTIDFHRANIRKKIGIRNIRANLRAHLLSIQ